MSATTRYARAFAAAFNRVVRKSASHSDVPRLLASLTEADRNGAAHGADVTKRGVIADYLTDLGRDGEASLLRDPNQHVIVRGGQIRRWTLRHLHEFGDRFHAAQYAGSPPDAPPMHRFHPSVAFIDRHTGDYDWDSATFDPARHMVHEATGEPLVGGATFTCHDFECPISRAPEEYADLLADTAFDPRNRVPMHVPEDRLRALAETVRHLPVDEVPG